MGADAGGQTLIVPDNLEAGAVVPQCLDNVYVSNELFGYMIEHNLGLKDPEVVARRDRDTKTEYMRALLYASQMVVNRAFFINNQVLKRIIKKTPDNVPDREAFIRLLRGGTVVPFLFGDQRRLDDPVEFATDPEAERILKELIADAGEFKCLRFALDDDANKKASAALASQFRRYFAGVGELEPEQVNVMASELMNGTPGAETEISPDVFKAFSEQLYAVARHVFESPRDRPATRDALYKQFLCIPGTAVDEGRYVKPSERRFIFELKKLFDLRYNTNLPDAIGRFAFTPAGLPGRSALCEDAIDANISGDSERLLDNLMKNVRETFMESTQKAMSVPLLADLTVEDVDVIRRTVPSWRDFSAAQLAILKNPLACLDLLPAFGKAFGKMQADIASWYYDRYKREASVEKYKTAVSIVLKVGTKLLAHNILGEGTVRTTVESAGPDLIPEAVKGFAARILVSVYDPQKRRIDRDRSYSLDLLNDQVELTRERVEELITRFGENARAEDQLRTSGQLANTGKEGES